MELIHRYCMDPVNLKRDNVIEIVKSAVFSAENLLIKENLQNEDALYERVHDILKAKIPEN